MEACRCRDTWSLLPPPFEKLLFEKIKSCQYGNTKFYCNQASIRPRKNPPFQPHILFLLLQKENVPLTVQEKRAARGIAIPQDPQETGECPADSPVYQMTLPPEHCRVVMASCTLDGIPGDGGTSAAFTNKTWSHTDRRCLPGRTDGRSRESRSGDAAG